MNMHERVNVEMGIILCMDFTRSSTYLALCRSGISCSHCVIIIRCAANGCRRSVVVRAETPLFDVAIQLCHANEKQQKEEWHNDRTKSSECIFIGGSGPIMFNSVVTAWCRRVWALEDCVIVIVDFVSFRYHRPLCSLFLYSLSSPSLSSLFLF